jgi:hypothetical protein
MKAGERELPVRLVMVPGGGLVLRCLCGAESARLTSSTVNTSMMGLRSSGRRIARASSDLAPGGVLRMAVHAGQCLIGQNAALVR